MRLQNKDSLWGTEGWYVRRRKAGLCKSCRQVTLDNRNVCLSHWLAEIAAKRTGFSGNWPILKEKLERQHYRCAYTGQLLIRGLNASLDHIKPVAKYPDLKNELSNVHWVLHDVNMAKRGLSHDEFLKMCRAVAEFSK